MGQFIEGVDRQQVLLLPECLDDYVDKNSPVRAIGAFVDVLGLAEFGFQTTLAATGRPGYHPGPMLRIYLFSYLNHVQSLRQLEWECSRNLELIWLTGGLHPDFKTIADFCENNGPAIRKACQQVDVALCRDINLLDGNLVAIDGRGFKAVNAKAKNYTLGNLGQNWVKLTRPLNGILMGWISPTRFLSRPEWYCQKRAWSAPCASWSTCKGKPSANDQSKKAWMKRARHRSRCGIHGDNAPGTAHCWVQRADRG